MRWEDPTWVADAHAWIREWLEGEVLGPAGPIEQPHVRPWATVMRVPTSGGDLWFKASMPPLAYEAAVVMLLAEHVPGRVPELVAADLERGWMLMADGGARLRELVEQERDLRRWLDVLPRYAELQIAAAPLERFATQADLVEAHALALPLGWVCRALNIQRFARELEPPARDERLEGVATRLRMFRSRLR